MKLDRQLTRDWLDFDDFKSRYEKVPVQEFSNAVPKKCPVPKLSVLIITYQHADFIRDALEGALMQKTDFPMEILISDDGSTDGTRQICIEYAERYPEKIRLFLHRRRNNIKVLGSPTGIFQIAYGLFSCRGQYVALCSGDDYWKDPLKLQKQFDAMEQSENTSFTYHDHVRLFPGKESPEGPYSVERIQTVVFRNVFDKLPSEFVEVMQEDTFLKFFLDQIGSSEYISDIEPAVIRFHPRSMYTSLDDSAVYQQRTNLWRRLIEACAGCSTTQRQAKKKLVEMIFYYYRNQAKTTAIRKAIQICLALRKEKMLLYGIGQIGRLVFAKTLMSTDDNGYP
jgi:glycosyltransferase involved in cell wall biosynthesis